MAVAEDLEAHPFELDLAVSRRPEAVAVHAEDRLALDRLGEVEGVARGDDVRASAVASASAVAAGARRAAPAAAISSVVVGRPLAPEQEEARESRQRQEQRRQEAAPQALMRAWVFLSSSASF